MKLMIANLFSLCITSIYVNIATNFALINERMFRMAERVYLETIIIQLLEQNAAGQAEHQADDQFHHFHDEVQLEVKLLTNKICFLTLRSSKIEEVPVSVVPILAQSV